MFKPGISIHAIQQQCQCLVFHVTMFLPLLLLCFFPAEAQSSTVQTTFAYPSFNSESCTDGSLICMGSVSGGDGYLRLSMEPEQVNSSIILLRNQIGRVLHKNPVIVWPAAISVTFTVRISTYPNSSNSGDGLTFIMAQDHNPSPPNSFGSYLGIMDKSTEGGVVRQLAVELDTYPNEFDPDGNHIGIDTTSIINPIVALSLNRTGIDLKSGRPVTVRLDYDSLSLQFRVYVAYEGNPLMNFFNHSINLSEILPNSVYVGFTASTGPYPESHHVLSWTFQSTLLPESNIVYVKHKTKIWKSVILAFGILIVVLVSILLIGKILRDRKARALRNDLEYRSMSAANMPTVFSYKQLSKATQKFSKENLLGTGAFGSVYKGLISSDPPTIIAVKKISATSQQGEKEYLAEICTIGRLRHKNLVQLQGWCHEGEHLLLVYEYMPNGSLDRYIGKLSLNWKTRHKILTGLASALLYLHEECGNPVLHRDVKPNNIMLDSEYNPHLGDFGLARLLRNESCATTRLAGTPGYLAPEVSYTGKATPESDVYSFGVVVLEVVLGTRSKGLFDSSLVDYVWSLYENDSLVSGVDRMLEGVYDEEEVKRALIVALACVHPDAAFRPKIRKVEQIFLNANEPLVDLPRTMPVGVYVSVSSRNEISTTTTTTTTTTSFDCFTHPCLPSKEERGLSST